MFGRLRLKSATVLVMDCALAPVVVEALVLKDVHRLAQESKSALWRKCSHCHALPMYVCFAPEQCKGLVAELAAEEVCLSLPVNATHGQPREASIWPC